MLSFARQALFGPRTHVVHQLMRTKASVSVAILNCDGSHDDFKAQAKDAVAVSDVFDTIKEDISKNNVFVYMKGVPQAPMCGFSMTACRILDAYGAKYGSRNVLEDPELREGIKKFSNWPTIPQVYVKGEFVGGCDILMQLHENGELSKILESDA